MQSVMNVGIHQKKYLLILMEYKFHMKKNYYVMLKI